MVRNELGLTFVFGLRLSAKIVSMLREMVGKKLTGLNHRAQERQRVREPAIDKGVAAYGLTESWTDILLPSK